MKYATVGRECETHESGVIVRIYQEKRFDVWDILNITSITLALAAIIFFCGVYVGADRAAEVIEADQIQTEEEAPKETDYYSPEVPLSHAEQLDLYEAAEEFEVDYYVMLGLIEQETEFRNVPGDGGKASGYCQIWRVYWKDLMNDIGAQDLNEPKDNFRTACAIMRQLTDRDGSVAGALTAYNKGSFNGRVSAYATNVLENAERWREIEKSHL